MDQMDTPWKWILTILKCKNEVPVRAWKADQKNGVISLVLISPSWFMVLKLSKIVSFLQFFADISKNSKAAAIDVYASECFRFALLENGVDYYAMI